MIYKFPKGRENTGPESDQGIKGREQFKKGRVNTGPESDQRIKGRVNTGLESDQGIKGRENTGPEPKPKPKPPQGIKGRENTGPEPKPKPKPKPKPNQGNKLGLQSGSFKNQRTHEFLLKDHLLFKKPNHLKEQKKQHQTGSNIPVNVLGSKPSNTHAQRFPTRQTKRVRKSKPKDPWNNFRKILPSRFGLIFINKTKRNTHCSMSNLFGSQATRWSIRGGQMAGRKRKTRYSLRNVLQATVKKLLALGFDHLVLQVKGFMLGRQFIYKTFYKRHRNIFKIILFKYNPSIAHNGCRAPKVRRL